MQYTEGTPHCLQDEDDNGNKYYATKVDIGNWCELWE